jgi:hypothetical protein
MVSIQQQIMLGFLAVSNGKLTQQQLANALQTWHASGNIPPPEIIVARCSHSKRKRNEDVRTHFAKPTIQTANFALEINQS